MSDFDSASSAQIGGPNLHTLLEIRYRPLHEVFARPAVLYQFDTSRVEIRHVPPEVWTD